MWGQRVRVHVCGREQLLLKEGIALFYKEVFLFPNQPSHAENDNQLSQSIDVSKF